MHTYTHIHTYIHTCKHTYIHTTSEWHKAAGGVRHYDGSEAEAETRRRKPKQQNPRNHAQDDRRRGAGGPHEEGEAGMYVCMYV